MRSFTAILLSILPFTIAAPQAPNLKMHVIWKHDKAKVNGMSKGSLQVLNGDKSALLGQSCFDYTSESQTLDTGNFAAMSLSMQVNENGFGTLSYGGDHKIRYNPEKPGGIVCTMQYGPGDAEVDCIVPWKGPSAPVESPLDDIKDCFSKPDAQSKSLEARQWMSGMTQCSKMERTVRVGDGEPKPRFYHQQLSEAIHCESAPECTVGQERAQESSVGFSASGSLYQWISAGFDVQKSWSSGNQYTCTGNKGDTVCIWYKTAFTEYTVRNVWSWAGGSCSRDSGHSEPFRLSSPNKDNRGGNYYCVIGPCRSQGEGYWQN